MIAGGLDDWAEDMRIAEAYDRDGVSCRWKKEGLAVFDAAGLTLRADANRQAVAPGPPDFDRLPDFLDLTNPRAAQAARDGLENGVSSLSEFAERGHPSDVPGNRELHVEFGRYG